MLGVPQLQPSQLAGDDTERVSVVDAVTRMPSASVNRSCTPGWGRFLRRISRVPAGQADQVDHGGGLGDPARPVPDAAVGVDDRVPAGGRG